MFWRVRMNSMINGMNSIRYQNRYRMSEKNNRFQVYVESETDVMAYKTFFSRKHENMKFFPVNGWEEVVKMVTNSDLDVVEQRMTIGIIDADLTHITGENRTNCNRVFLTDYHDVETLFLSLFNIQSFIDSGEIREAENPLDKAKEISFEIGLYRYVNNKDGDDKFKLRFSGQNGKKKLPYFKKSFYKKIDSIKKEIIDLQYYLSPDFVSNRENYVKLLEEEICSINREELEDYQIINGHDFLPIFMKLFNDSAKAYNFGEGKEREFWNFILLVVDSYDFQQTILYKDISNYITESVD